MGYVNLTLFEFQKRFSNEEDCIQAIYDARWPRGFVCPYCQHNDGYRLSTRHVVQCACCRRQTSILSNTIFHKTHVPLVNWFLIIYFVAQDKGGVSALKLSKQLGMRYATVLFILQRLRFAMGTRDENLTLAGYIELDEAFFGGRRKNSHGRKARSTSSFAKKQVLVFVESEGKQAGNLVMRVIPNATWPVLKSILDTKIEAEPPHSYFRTDGWQAHDCVIALGHRLKMGHVPNDLQDDVFPCLSYAITHVRRFLLGTYHQYCKYSLQLYLNEFCYRWNRRHQWYQLASRLVLACALSPPMKHA